MFQIFTDFHHASLLQSLILLFEKRLGGNVYRPIGTEWYKNGFWKVYDHPATVQQFLGIGAATPDGSRPLNEVLMTHLTPPNSTIVYHCKDIDSDQTNKAITLQGFMALPFNIVIASLPYHIEPFKRLCAIHPNKPKLIYQIGNAWTTDAGLAPNIMASAYINGVPETINFISYHQEFDTNTFSKAEGSSEVNTVKSFINCFNTAGHFAEDWQLFQKVESLMPGWSFKSHGGQCRDGAIGPAKELARTMQNSRFIWHTKAGGDGYGHILHNAAAVGRPMIVKSQYYEGKMGKALLIDGKTCIAIDGLNPQEVVNKITHYNEENRYQTMCKEAYNNFMTVVNFDKEAEQIKTFLAKLQ